MGDLPSGLLEVPDQDPATFGEQWAVVWRSRGEAGQVCTVAVDSRDEAEALLESESIDVPGARVVHQLVGGWIDADRDLPGMGPHPVGLCGNRDDHAPHLVEYAAVAGGPMWCHADQGRRLPWAAERAART